MYSGDAIRLLLRRFVLPVLVSALIAPYAAALIPSIWEGRSLLSVEISLRFIAILSLFTGAGILLVGLPAGFLLARTRVGLGASLSILIVVGAVGGWLLLLLAAAITGSGSDFPARLGLLALLAGAPAGAAAASVWTLFNADLFRGQPDPGSEMLS